MKISIIHPSRQRPEMAAKTARKWLSSAKDGGDIEYTLCIDEDDPMRDEYYSCFYPIFSNLDNSGILDCTSNTAIEAINEGAKESTGDLLIVVSDDFDCPLHWDDTLLKALEGKEDFIVKTSDLVANRHGQMVGQPWIITLPIMDRKYYERFGYIYYPEYLHMFCDTEMTHVADLTGRKITLPINFPHNHYSAKGQPDAVSQKADKTWAQGEALYLSRLKENFGLKPEDIKGELQAHQSHIDWLKSKSIIVHG